MTMKENMHLLGCLLLITNLISHLENLNNAGSSFVSKAEVKRNVIQKELKENNSLLDNKHSLGSQNKQVQKGNLLQNSSVPKG